MFKKLVSKRMIARFLILGILLSSFAPYQVVNATQMAQEESLPISAGVQELLQTSEDFIEVMVLFKESADWEAPQQNWDVDTGDTLENKEKKAFVGNLQEAALLSQDGVLAYLDNQKELGNVKEYESFFIVNSLYVSAKADVITTLAKAKNVESIELNQKIYREKPIPEKGRFKRFAFERSELEWNIKAINADDVWKKGFTGEGVVVGILDSAVDITHPALKTKFRGYDPASGQITYEGNYIDTIENKQKPGISTDVAHGTHVMGIVLGSEVEAGGASINRIGVAPDAKWISARVFGDTGESSTQGFLKAAQWMLAPGGDAAMAPHIINNSWGTGYNNTDIFFEKSVEAWKRAGILPVFASGNKLPGEDNPGPKSIASPANYRDSFAVGAVDSDFKLAIFSKRGPSPFEGVNGYKPEVSAPGVKIRSAARGGYVYMSGTSMAAPHVTGVAALLKSANTQLSPDAIADILKRTAIAGMDENYPDSPNHGYGYGIVNALAAVNDVTKEGSGTIYGDVRDKSSKPIAASIVVEETERSTQSNQTTGEYSLKHPTGRWQVEAKAYGYKPVKKEVSIRKDQRENVLFSLEKIPTANMELTIKDASGHVVEGAYVRLLEDSNLGIADSSVDGKVQIADILRSEEEYTLRVFKEGYEIFEEKIVVNEANITKEIQLTTKLNNREIKEYKFDTEAVNPKSEHNIRVGDEGYPAVAVQFIPEKMGGRIESVSAYFLQKSWLNTADKVKVSIIAKDKRGRIETLLEPKVFDFVPGQYNTFSLEKYHIHTDKPYYAVFEAEGANLMIVGLDQSGDEGHSYIFSSNNLVPITEAVIYGALKIRSTMSYEADSESIIYVVKKASLNKIEAGDRVITGKADPNQRVQLVIGELRLETIANDEGVFEFTINRSLISGQEVICYAKNDDGIKSEAYKTYVVTDKKRLKDTIEYVEKFATEVENVDENLMTELNALKEEAKTLKTTVEQYETNTVPDSLEKARILEYQKQIDETVKKLRNKLIEISPYKERLHNAIAQAEELLDSVWISSSGRDVPRTKKWVGSSAWNTYNSYLNRARAVYDNAVASEEQINRILKDLENGKKLFESTMQDGKEEIIEIDTTYPNGTYEGEGRADGVGFLANHVIIKIADGKLIDIQVSEWHHDAKILKAIEEDGFIRRILDSNRLDVKRTKGYESYCKSIVKAIGQALEKSLRPGTEVTIDKIRLKEQIDLAKETLQTYPISENGRDVASGTKWTTRAAYDVLKRAIDMAEIEYARKDLTTDLRDRAITLLNTEVRNFISSLNEGISDVVSGTYKDGSYEVRGKGLGGENLFKIVIENGKIATITIVEWEDTKGFDTRISPLIASIVRQNGVDGVDTVSGATFSSNSLITATKKALEEAKSGKKESKPSGILKERLALSIYAAKKALYDKRDVLLQQENAGVRQSSIVQIKAAMEVQKDVSASKSNIEEQIRILQGIVNDISAIQ